MSKLPTKEGLMRWVDDAAELHDLDARETLILTKFASYADAAMEAWAAIKTLARQGRSSERKVQYVLREFEAKGFIRRTDRMHRIQGTTRDVPVYVFCGFLDELRGVSGTGARRAPIGMDGCTTSGAMGAQGVHPHNELMELTPSNEGETRAHPREALFDRLEQAYPKRGLGFTNRERARTALWQLLDEGLDGEDLVEAAKGFAGATPPRLKDLGLDYWLHDRRYRMTWPEPQLAFEDSRPASAAGHPKAAPAEDQALWTRAANTLADNMTEATYGTWVKPCVLCAHEGQLYLVAFTRTACDWLQNNAGRRIANAWSDADPRGRQLTLLSKSEFEAVLRRQPEGAMS